MARGGVRTGAGRKAGTPNKASVQRQAAIQSSGLTPLDYMLNVLRDDTQPVARRDDMAKAAAPYVHPKLSSVDGKFQHDAGDDLKSFLERIAIGGKRLASPDKE